MKTPAGHLYVDKALFMARRSKGDILVFGGADTVDADGELSNVPVDCLYCCL